MTDLSARTGPEGGPNARAVRDSDRCIGEINRGHGLCRDCADLSADLAPRPVEQVVHHLDQAAEHEWLGHPRIGLKLLGC